MLDFTLAAVLERYLLTIESQWVRTLYGCNN
jgi:hypothetical protein